MARTTTTYRCTACGHTVGKWMGRCPNCRAWGTLDEVGARSTPVTSALPVTEIDPAAAAHRPTGVGELDRVLGGGLVPGSAVLLAGEPGVGKSTLLLTAAAHWAAEGRRVLYVTAEESAGQVRHRAERTGALSPHLYLAAESDLETAVEQMTQLDPALVVVDSLQTLHAPGVEGVAGGVAQTRAVTSTLTTYAKTSGVPVVAVGHVTKDGTVAGPRTVEHLVDVVLSMDGDRHSALRFLRGVKNRFGATDEVGCFEQTAGGIREVTDPSGLFLHHRETPVPGTAVTVAMDGRRALVGEVQTLAVPTGQHNPRRVVTGVDGGRVSMILAVLAQRCGRNLAQHEVYVATVGGMRIVEPAADLTTALALDSVLRDAPLPLDVVVLGEVGLGGEVRRVPDLGLRLAEAARLGFRRAVVPDQPVDVPAGLTVTRVPTLADAIRG
ncbi:DNA repair protein RadA [Corynebacterium bovis]|uniref:DNA repair protein RadA n=1 Tax=Corynebacterium bovis TaxID=36808 RepID=UPI000F64E8AC|nr:DNA repair protein RadA [Corynebacterium bovis]RRO96876.1 DNA repair protein RadA [Corynebacterium bovis]RRQ15037.1 DNA repair protein RadA [Corynebacterium bovis]